MRHFGAKDSFRLELAIGGGGKTIIRPGDVIVSTRDLIGRRLIFAYIK